MSPIGCVAIAFQRQRSALRSPGGPVENEVCMYLLLQYLLQSCSRGGRGIVEDMLRYMTSRGLCGLLCPSHTSERGGEGDCVKEGGGEEGERERERAGGATTPQPSILRLILSAAALAAASQTLLFRDW